MDLCCSCSNYLKIAFVSLFLTIEERNRLLGNIEAGSQPDDVTERFGVTKRTVYRYTH